MREAKGIVAMFLALVWALTHKDDYEKMAREQAEVYRNTILPLLEKSE